MVSIPKDWARAHDIDSGSEVAVFPGERSLVVEPMGGEDAVVEGAMDVSGLEGQHLRRAVIAMYVSGFDVIRFTADRFESGQRRDVREASQHLAGLEVIEETGTEIVFQDLLDSGEVSVERTVERMRLIAEDMFRDAVTAVLAGGDGMSEDVIERDEDVDRMFAMITRLFRASLRDFRSEEELGISRTEAFDLHTAARQLERIADHATKIARVAQDVEEVPEGVRDDVASMRDDAIATVDDALEALLELDGEDARARANTALDAARDMDGRAREIDQDVQELDAATAHLLGLVIDSVNRTADYGGNIAETALHAGTPAGVSVEADDGD